LESRRDLPLGVREEVSLSEAEISILRALEGYDLGPVRRRLVHHGIMPPSWVDEAIFEFRRYLGLAALSREPVSMPSKAVDDVWHTCLMFTRLYEDFCAKTVGRFVHHEPADEGADGHEAGALDFRAAYTRLYGPPGRLWKPSTE
jgi:hypothetical protein